MRTSFKRSLAAVGVAGAFAIAADLYFKTQPASTERHAQIVDRFGALHTLDARIAQEALAARHGLAAHYDPLTRSTRRFEQEVRELEVDLAPLTASHPDLSTALADLKGAMLERASVVERFKTQNSVLKNSLYYLPLAGRQVIDAIENAKRSGDPAAAEVSGERQQQIHAVSDLVERTLTQNLLGGRDETARVKEQLQLAKQLEPRIPPQAQERYRLLIKHAEAASSMQQSVDPIMRDEVLQAPVGPKLTLLEQRYGRQFQAGLSEAAFYRHVLYGWSTLLLIAVLVAALKLRSLYSHLESLVAERTRKLNEALDELWGEMALAKKIQTALVPRELSLGGCEVAAVMRPTDQVGGDYYDVFEVDGVEWVFIGDVSGHGVPAGLVMMMCQTAVHSVLSSRPEIGPDELLATVNRTLTQNIERLGEDKYMTISALRRDPDGTFKMAGMHQDILVYRAESDSVERLYAQGTWLGITSDIRALNPVRTVTLSPGDAMVLYTDGITEARRDDQMLDIEGLESTVREHGAESAQRLLSSILELLESYEIKDDVAAVIIKQVDPVGTRNERAA